MSDPGDVTVTIAFNATTDSYSFNWRDKEGHQPPAELHKSLSEIELVVSDIMQEIQDIVRDDYRIQPDAVATKLRSRGIELWEDLIPPAIQSRFIATHADIKRMRIVSDGDPFPWELLCPFGLNAESDQVFLVDMVELSRWKYGSLPPATIAPHRADFVIPSQDLKEAKREFRQVSKLLKNWSGSLEGRPVKDAPALYKLFEQATVSLLHFACHNGFDKSNGQIVLKSTRVKPSDFRGLDGRLKRAPPFVFMNACRTDATPPAYIKIGKKDGWAHRFLQAGVGAFVGTLWEVRDNSAREFAAAVYSGLINNKPFGEALRCARKALRDDKPADPTWLAYSFYGSASARLKKPVPVA